MKEETFSCADAFQLDAAHGFGFAERDAQRVHIGVVADFHSLDTITFAR